MRFLCLVFVVLSITAECAADSGLQQRARQSLVRVNRRCSGVCVHPDGWIVSAAHCFDWNKLAEHRANAPGLSPWRSVPVQFDGQPETRAELRHVTSYDGGTDLAVLKVPDGRDSPHLRVSLAAPEVGDTVFSVGYPAGRFAYTEARIKSIGEMGFQDSSRGIAAAHFRMQCIVTDGYINAGNSGGPLINRNGEVIGVASGAYSTTKAGEHAPPGGIWADWNAINHALRVCKVQYDDRPPSPENDEQPVLYVFTRRGCIPCEKFKTDFSQNQPFSRQLRRLCVVKIDSETAEDFSALAQRYGVTDAPAFVLHHPAAPIDTAHIIRGYDGPDWLLAQLESQRYPGVPHKQSPPDEKIRGDPVQIDLRDGDLAAVEAVFLVRKMDFESALFETGATVSEKALQKPLERELHKRLKGKVAVRFVFERIEPTRFADLAQVAGMPDESKATALILVRKSFPDGLRGLLIERAEELAKQVGIKRLSGLGIVPLFERIEADSADWHTAQTVLERSNEAVADPWLPISGGGALTAFIGMAANRLRKRQAT